MSAFHFLKSLAVLFVIMVMSGCATYGDGLNKAITEFQQGHFDKAESALQQALKPEGNDRLLYHLELAVIKHLQNDFAASNALLDQAERIADELETILLSDTLSVLMSNPRQGPYGGADFERLHINYYKALNFFGLAMQAESRNAYLDALEGARIESRRLIIRLNDMRTRKGTYQEQADKDAQTFTQLLKIFEKLQGNLIDMDQLQYRDDAMAHYLTGISFEKNGEYNDARISYQNAATTYEQGFVKQYRLDEAMIEQSWFDTIRMMRKDGGYNGEWQRLARQKLSPERRQELDQWMTGAQVIVLEHKGMAPHRKEMNLELSVNPDRQTLQLRPYFHGNDINQLAWFYVLYADKDLFDAITHYLDATVVGFVFNSFTKTVNLGPLWSVAEDLGAIRAIGGSLRVTVPYYDPVPPLGDSVLFVNGQQRPMLLASNPAQMALQEQIVRSGYHIQMALARSTLKAISADLVAQQAGGGLWSIAASLAMQLTDAAETRNWLLLPQDIRIQRIWLEPGNHQLTLQSTLAKSQSQQASTDVSVNEGDIHFWRVRSVAPSGKTTHNTPLLDAPANLPEATESNDDTTNEARRPSKKRAATPL
ncbi:MAG: hypothetical protein IBX52_05095 [Bacterioplanes sp.]|nr:hypothetical protein [Bacterioplanes sp.]